MILVKEIAEKDLPDLALLYEELSGNPSRLDKMKEIYAQLKNNPHYILLGAYNQTNQLTGTIMGLLCYDMAMECQPIMFMENMVVDKNYRKKGIGKQLLNKLEEMSKERNCVFIQYCSSIFRKEAHQFYESMGYDPGTVKGYRKYLGSIRVKETN